MAKFTDRIRHAWNAFNFQEKHPVGTTKETEDLGSSYSYRPDRSRLRVFNERSIVSAIYTRLGIDVAAIAIRHVRLDDDGAYADDIQSGLNNCLTVEANCDQAARAFRQDIALSMFDEGVIAVVPVDTTLNPLSTGGYDIGTMRVGRILQWFPKHVQVRLYNDQNGMRQDLVLPKDMVGIIENPMYSVMNEPNSTLQRLIRKLNLLDAVDEQSASGNLDLIIQLPYTIKTEGRRAEAQKRLKEIEFQLKGSQYGIAYADGTEKITQLNRPAENNLMGQVEYLTNMLYSQLGLTPEIMNGSGTPDQKLEYYNRTIEPILAAITEEMKRKFLTKTARSQGQSIMYFHNPLKLIPIADLAELVDKFTRNEVLSSNEFRSLIGYKPSKDPKANQLLNKNLPIAYDEPPKNGTALSPPPKSSVPQIPAIPQGVSNNGA